MVTLSGFHCIEKLIKSSLDSRKASRASGLSLSVNSLPIHRPTRRREKLAEMYELLLNEESSVTTSSTRQQLAQKQKELEEMMLQSRTSTRTRENLAKVDAVLRKEKLNR